MPPDRVEDYIVARAAAEPTIGRVVLFGSRARGDAHVRSDYDLAVSAPGWSRGEWSRWAVDVREHVPTLCGVDLVWLEDVIDPDLREGIEQDGRVVYERR